LAILSNGSGSYAIAGDYEDTIIWCVWGGRPAQF